jgi:hypothetical protein
MRDGGKEYLSAVLACWRLQNPISSFLHASIRILCLGHQHNQPKMSIAFWAMDEEGEGRFSLNMADLDWEKCMDWLMSQSLRAA